MEFPLSTFQSQPPENSVKLWGFLVVQYELISNASVLSVLFAENEGVLALT